MQRLLRRRLLPLRLDRCDFNTENKNDCQLAQSFLFRGIMKFQLHSEPAKGGTAGEIVDGQGTFAVIQQEVGKIILV